MRSEVLLYTREFPGASIRSARRFSKLKQGFPADQGGGRKWMVPLSLSLLSSRILLRAARCVGERKRTNGAPLSLSLSTHTHTHFQINILLVLLFSLSLSLSLVAFSLSLSLNVSLSFYCARARRRRGVATGRHAYRYHQSTMRSSERETKK